MFLETYVKHLHLRNIYHLLYIPGIHCLDSFRGLKNHPLSPFTRTRIIHPPPSQPHLQGNSVASSNAEGPRSSPGPRPRPRALWPVSHGFWWVFGEGKPAGKLAVLLTRKISQLWLGKLIETAFRWIIGSLRKKLN